MTIEDRVANFLEACGYTPEGIEDALIKLGEFEDTLERAGNGEALTEDEVFECFLEL